MKTITSPTEIDRLFAGGRRVSNPALLVLALPHESEPPEGRLLFVAGVKLGNAVTRNRAKRLLREAARRAGGPWTGWDIALVARPATSASGSGQLDAALSRALQSLGISR